MRTLMYERVIDEYPYMESSIREFSKKYLMKSLQFGDDEYILDIQRDILLDDLYVTLHDLYDSKLSNDLNLSERWEAHLSLDEILSKEDVLYEEVQIGSWMEQTHDYPTEQMVDNGFYNTKRFKDLFNNFYKSNKVPEWKRGNWK